MRVLKTAIVHDVLLEYGGSERFLETLLEVFPNASIYTLYINKNNPALFSIVKKGITSSFLQKIPFLYKLGKFFSLLKVISWVYFYFLDLSEYNLIITSCHSYNSKIVQRQKNSFHVSYIHTPPRYLYKEYNEFSFIKDYPFNIIFWPILKILRYIDYKSAQNPDLLVTSSNTVQKRIEKYYRRESIVLPPPLRISNFDLKKMNKHKRYYVAHSRLVKQKGFDLILQTCIKYNLPLVVVGEGYLRTHLSKLANPSIKFLGRVNDSELPKIYRNAIALLYAAIDEDFGLVPLEALFYGVPVVAYKSGGIVENIIHYKTGIFFTKYNTEAFYRAIRLLSRLKISSRTCRESVRRFDVETFNRKLKLTITQALKKNGEEI